VALGTGQGGGDTTQTLDVRGMTCAACQANVQRALVRQPGVHDASVNLMTGEARVVFDPTVVDIPGLVSAVEAIGYEAAPTTAGARSVDTTDHRDETAATGRQAVVALACGAVTMTLSMPTMAPHAGEHGATADPLMSWTAQRVTPALAAAMPWLFTIPREVLLWTLLVLTTFVMVWAGRRFYVNGIRALAHGLPDMNSLVAVGTLAAFGFSLVATFRPLALTAAGVAPDVYYEAVVIIIAFVLTGRWLEARARHQAVAALRGLARLQPREAVVVEAGEERSMPIEAVHVGQTVLVRPGARVPLDGTVTTGVADVDESAVTGESMPVVKGPSATVTAGTLVTTGALFVRVGAEAGFDTLSRLLELMREAQLSRAPIQRLADRVSAVFVPTVLALAALTFVAWVVVGGAAALAPGLAAAVAVLIVACPCAMGLAVPTAVLVATGRAGSLGILVKGGDALQRAGSLRTVVFDKTGTLTVGAPSVVDTLALDGNPTGLVAAAAAVERLSEHPLARAIVAHATDHPGLAPAGAATAFRSEAGVGVSAVVAGRRIHVASVEAIIRSAATVAPPALAAFLEAATARGATVVCVGREDPSGRLEFVGAIAVADAIRESSRQAVTGLQAAGIRVLMLSGDRPDTARAVAAQAGITEVIAGVLPTGKVEEIRRLQQEGAVGMVGDGVNDAPALAQADVGFAMGTGTDVAIQAADITLMRPDLRLVGASLRLAQMSLRVMRQNLFWAFAYNVVAIPLAAGALYPAYGILLSPTVASAAMVLSSISVVANSLRLRRTPIGTS